VTFPTVFNTEAGITKFVLLPTNSTFTVVEYVVTPDNSYVISYNPSLIALAPDRETSLEEFKQAEAELSIAPVALGNGNT
jgi:hypothetical protein